mmetsp:Transcript_4168/g.6761  ORF Transcript_4168/g.6761 Transcript_4168/m.6761 type:complete len:232 (+) Transcript_4168:16-711(+)
MPKSKRAQVFHLSKVKKVGRERKEAIVEDIRDNVDDYKHLFVFCVHNMRTEKMNRIRAQFRDTSRIYMAKNKLMQIALGRTPEEECKQNISAVCDHIIGKCGIMLTNSDKQEVLDYFAEMAELDFARSGFVATQEISFDEGPLPQFVHTMEPYLRKLGMPVKLNRGVIELEQSFTVCKKGETLTPDQAQMLKLMNIKLADFKITLTCHWSDGKFTKLADPREAQRAAVQGQ